MKKQLLLLALAGLFITPAQAQVEDVSLIVTPTAGYNWFDKKSTIDNGFMYGGQVGFGFGKIIELRGIYERSANLKQNFGKYEKDIQGVFPGFNFQGRNVKVTRIGGEFKANIPTGIVSPYILVGTGVQTFKKESGTVNGTDEKLENLYGNAGLGFKVNLGQRVTFNVEGRGYVYNMNASSFLYDPSGTSSFDDWVNNQERQRMFNWGVNAGLQFYLGGRNEKYLSPLDRAYLSRFNNSVKGVHVSLAPVAAYMKFNDKSGFKSTTFLGGDLEVNFSDFVGLKGYYYQAANISKDRFRFDYLSMFGLDFVGRLNVPRGIVPYVTVGGGYLYAQDGYTGKEKVLMPGTYEVPSSAYYAKGGVGLEIPLSTHVGLFGSANILYTIDENEQTDVLGIRSVDQLRQHQMYNAGLRIKIGKKANTRTAVNDAFDDRYSGKVNEYEKQIKDYQKQIDAYDAREEELKKELLDAYEKNDTLRMAEINREREVNQVKKEQAAAPKKEEKVKEKKDVSTPSSDKNLIRMTPAELESLIEKTIREVESDSAINIESRLDRLEQLLINSNRQGAVTPQTTQDYQQKTGAPQPAVDDAHKAANDRLIQEISKLNQKLEEQNRQINDLKLKNAEQSKVVVVSPETPATTSPSQAIVPATNEPMVARTVHHTVGQNGVSLFVGPNFGSATTFNMGARGYFGLGNSIFQLMPEAYVALGKKVGFGFDGNVIANIPTHSLFSPYVGVGAGIHNLDKFRFSTNVVLGTTYNLGYGALFADYSVRGLFKNNQIAVGYILKF